MGSDPGQKPFFDMALGEAEKTLLAVPPFSFPGVTSRVFPLRARMDVLSSFCQSYLNVAPPEICLLQPYLPYVFLVVLDYGEMAVETANLGWVSQHEIFFAVPLEKWHRHKGRMVFDGWVLNTPFIFVDNPTSLTTGREVYGWPKILCSLLPSQEEWLADPRSPIRFLELCVQGFGSRDAQEVPLLAIVQDVGQNPSLTPSDLVAADPFRNLSRFTRGAWSAGVGLMDLLLRPPLSGFGPQRGRLEGGTRFLTESLHQLSDFLQDPGVDVVTLKQFRDAKYANEICYQALVESRLSVDRVNQYGLLGLYNLLLGDPSGGFRIRLFDNPKLPITELLGLRAVRQTLGGVTVSTVEPFFPSWTSVDLTYGRGKNLGWRTLRSPWYGRESEVVEPASRSYSYCYNYDYNTVAGAAQQEWIGPYILPKFCGDVFPLQVFDTHQLDHFIDQYFNQSEQHQFKRWGDYVYMVTSRSRTFSQAQSAVNSEVAFYVPLRWYERDRFKGYVIAKPYAFVDDPVFAMTMREVLGVPAFDATIETPTQSWLRQGPVLRVKADVFTVLDAGMGEQRRTLLEVVPRREPGGPARSGGLSGSNLEGLCEVARKVFAQPTEILVLTLKQFRDARDPDRACYQALVLQGSRIFQKPPQRLGEEMKIHVYRYPNLPLAQTLGLVDPKKPTKQPRRQNKQVMVDVLTPQDPFRVELNINMDFAEVLSQEAGNFPWISRQEKKPQKKDPERIFLQELVEAVLGAKEGLEALKTLIAKKYPKSTSLQEIVGAVEAKKVVEALKTLIAKKYPKSTSLQEIVEAVEAKKVVEAMKTLIEMAGPQLLLEFLLWLAAVPGSGSGDGSGEGCAKEESGGGGIS